MGQQTLPGEVSPAPTPCRSHCRGPRAIGPQRIAAHRAGQCGRGKRGGNGGIRPVRPIETPRRIRPRARPGGGGKRRGRNRQRAGGRSRQRAAALEEATAEPAPPPGLCEQFDARAVRAQAERFAPYQAILEQWLQQRGAAAGEARACAAGRSAGLDARGRAGRTSPRRLEMAGDRASRSSAFWPFAPRNPSPATTPSSLPPIGASTSPPHNGRRTVRAG